MVSQRRVYLSLVSSLIIVLSCLPVASAKRVERTQAQHYLEHVKFLAGPELQGRGAGTPGLERASKYIADQFRQLGLRPAGEAGTYLQPFQVTVTAKPGKNNQISVNGESGSGSLRMESDYLPLSFSSNGSANGPVVFAGFGITASEFHYDDYAKLDVKDKIVLVLRYEPSYFRGGTPDKEKGYTHHSHLVSKAINARNHGAKALILVNGQIDQKQEDKLISFGTVSGPENVGILMLQVKNAVANEWLKPSGKTLSGLRTEINDKREPRSFALPEKVGLDVRVDIEREQATVSNVAGYLAGRSKEYIIIGAHYDHLGLGNESSLAPSQIGTVHPGADDNASGTAGVLELARLFSERKEQPKRGILFMTFAGEEIGLLGSSQWVNHPTLPLQDAVAMINMDMIGRVNGTKLYIGGTGTGSTFEPLLKRITSDYDFKIDFSQDGYSASDHTSFASKSIPVLFFFSGLHGDYHKPSDTWDKISATRAAEVVDLVFDVATQLVADESRPQFKKKWKPARTVAPSPVARAEGTVRISVRFRISRRLREALSFLMCGRARLPLRPDCKRATSSSDLVTSPSTTFTISPSPYDPVKLATSFL